MRKNRQFSTYRLIGLLAVLSVIGILKGCEGDRQNQPPSVPDGKQAYQLTLNVPLQPNPNAKAAQLTVTAMGVDEYGTPIGPKVGPVKITQPTLPVSIPLTLYKPPCRYLITVTATLTRGAERTESTIIDICEGTTGELSIDPYEEPIIGDIQFRAPASAIAGQMITVSCTVKQVSAPDSASYPLFGTLSEEAEEGLSVSGAMTQNSWLSGAFPDPYPLLASQTQRVFTCSVTDDRSAPKTAQKIVPRMLPTATPTPTATPIPTATPTATPTPNACLVANSNDAGPGSLRQVLAAAPVVGCTAITFAAGVSTITLNSQLTISSGPLTIDGGAAGVTIDGNKRTRVFGVTGYAMVTFQNLRIINGLGGVYNDTGTVTIESSTTISGHTGSGIYNGSGTLTVNGTVSGNTTPNSGGGILNNGNGTLTVNGTVSGNTASDGGGIYNENGTLTVNGTVSGNTAASYGGGILNSPNGTVTVNGTVSGNTAASYGGGIFGFGGTVNGATPFTVSGNTASVCNNYYYATSVSSNFIPITGTCILP